MTLSDLVCPRFVDAQGERSRRQPAPVDELRARRHAALMRAVEQHTESATWHKTAAAYFAMDGDEIKAIQHRRSADRESTAAFAASLEAQRWEE